MTTKKAKKLLLKKLYKNPDRNTKRMFIIGFSEKGLIKKLCTIENCIEYIKNETLEGIELIKMIKKYYKSYDQLI